MTVARNAGEVLAQHTTLELECIDRMYLNVYVPLLQSGGGTAVFFRVERRNPMPSSALTAPMTRRLVSDIERFAQREGIGLVRFERFERKDERTQTYLRRFEAPRGCSTSARRRRRRAWCAPNAVSTPCMARTRG